MYFQNITDINMKQLENSMETHIPALSHIPINTAWSRDWGSMEPMNRYCSSLLRPFGPEMPLSFDSDQNDTCSQYISINVITLLFFFFFSFFQIVSCLYP
jgi:hypothetical protein